MYDMAESQMTLYDYVQPFGGTLDENNRWVKLAKEIDADGVHLGQDDLDIKAAREYLGADKIIGVSAHNVKEALEAENGGAPAHGLRQSGHPAGAGAFRPADRADDSGKPLPAILHRHDQLFPHCALCGPQYGGLSPAHPAGAGGQGGEAVQAHFPPVRAGTVNGIPS